MGGHFHGQAYELVVNKRHNLSVRPVTKFQNFRLYLCLKKTVNFPILKLQCRIIDQNRGFPKCWRFCGGFLSAFVFSIIFIVREGSVVFRRLRFQKCVKSTTGTVNTFLVNHRKIWTVHLSLEYFLLFWHIVFSEYNVLKFSMHIENLSHILLNQFIMFPGNIILFDVGTWLVE